MDQNQSALVKKKRGRPAQSKQIEMSVVFDAAIQEFANKGFDGAKLSEIATQSSISNSLLTYHFDHKEDLWKQSVQHLGSKLLKRFEEVHGYFKDLHGIAAFKAYTRQFIYFSAEYPEFYKLVFHEMCTQTDRAKWMIQYILQPTHTLSEGDDLKEVDGKATFQGYPIANLSLIIIGAANAFFIHAFQMREMYGIDPFQKEEIEKHADIVIDLLFARFEHSKHDRP